MQFKATIELQKVNTMPIIKVLKASLLEVTRNGYRNTTCAKQEAEESHRELEPNVHFTKFQ